MRPITSLLLLVLAVPAAAKEEQWKVRIELRESEPVEEGAKKPPVEKLRRLIELRLVEGRRAELLTGRDVALVNVQQHGKQLIKTVTFKSVGLNVRITARTAGERVRLSGRIEFAEIMGEATNPIDTSVKNPVIVKRLLELDLDFVPGAPLAVARLTGRDAMGRPIRLELQVTLDRADHASSPDKPGPPRLTGILYAGAPDRATATLLLGRRQVRVAAGQTFEHGGKRWRVVSIGEREVVLEAGGKRTTLRLADRR